MSTVVGIDLGTTNSGVAVLENKAPRMILNDSGSNITPSAVWEDPSGKLVFGATAYEKAGAALRFKRFMGSDAKLRIGTREFSPEECSGLILRKLADDARRTLRQDIGSAVITVPANWKDARRRATEAAGRLAGLHVERLINEPTAAAMAFGMKADADGKTIAVYDLGGGTFDVTLLRVHQKVFDVITSCGDDALGGMDFDQKILGLIMSRVEDGTGYRLPPPEARDPKLGQRIRELELKCEKAKHELSFAQETPVSFGFLDLHNSEPLGVDESISRADFERLIDLEVNRTLQYMESALRAAKIRPSDVDEVVLVGGSTRIPLVRQRVAEYFDKEPLTGAVNPDEAVALGAAIQAGIISQEEVTEDSPVALDIVNNSLGVEVVQRFNQQLVPGIFSKIIEKGTKVPTRACTESYRTASDQQTSIEICCYEGEAPVTQQNTFLPPAISVDGLPPQPAGEVRIDITFVKTVNDMLEVSWAVPDTEIAGTHTIVMRSGLHSEEEFNRKKNELDRLYSHGRQTQTAPGPPKIEGDPLEKWRASSLAARFKSLIERAEAVLSDRPDVSNREQFESTLKDLKQAVIDQDEESAEDLDLRLTDYLFDLE